MDAFAPKPQFSRPEPAVDGHFAGSLTPALVGELKIWTWLSVSALAIAGGLALLLAFSRVPGAQALMPGDPQALFNKGLVAHVTFAFVVWYVGMQAAITVFVSGPVLTGDWWQTAIGRISAGLGISSFALLLLPVLLNLGQASINNYVPVLTHPFFYAGLAVLSIGVIALIARLLIPIIRARHVESLTFAVACSGVIFCIGVGCVLISWLTMPADLHWETVNERLFWGGGHVLQFANTAMLVAAVGGLCRVGMGEMPLPRVLWTPLFLVFLAGAAVGPLIYLIYPAGSPDEFAAFTALYWWVLAVPAAVPVLGTIYTLIRHRSLLGKSAEVGGLAMMVLLFAVGGIFGFLESSTDTRTPAHYHAMLIAVSLTFMAFFFAVLVPALNRRTASPKMRMAVYLLLGGGQLMHSCGLYLAGWLGVARKTAGAEQGLDTLGKVMSMTLMGVGGLIAVVGGVIFVVMAIKCLLRPVDDPSRDMYSGAAPELSGTN